MGSVSLRDNAYWADAKVEKFADIAYLENSLAEAVASKDDRASVNAHSLMMAYFEMTLLQYSVGASVESIARYAIDFLCTRFTDYVTAHPPESPLAMPRPSIHRINRFFALLVLSRPTLAQGQAFVSAYDLYQLHAIESLADRDSLREMMSAFLTKKPRSFGQRLDWPEAYGSLRTAIAPQTPNVDRPGLMSAFLDAWYDVMASEMAAQTEAHTSSYPVYVGYWCLEAAAGVVIAGIDDTRFRSHPHYPADFADLARDAS